MTETATDERLRGSVREVGAAFLKLGLTSFGGPIAHLGYFREEFVVRRRWLDEAAFAEMIGLCQFLPGPASSQLGFALGLQRAGFGGALVAWLAFTLPSALLMFGFALWQPNAGGPLAEAIVHGLKLVAVAIVAHAVLGMARSLTPDRRRAAIAILGLTCVMLAGAIGQIAAIVAGGLAGLWLCRTSNEDALRGVPAPFSRRIGAAFGIAFALLLFGLPLLAALSPSTGLAIADAFYRTGALVFGGGHVVLPLLQEAVVADGRVGADAFLSGYGAAQALPGPLFSFAAYLGALAGAPDASIGIGVVALIAIFLPGLLILLAVLPFWTNLRASRGAQAAMRGVNAAVVGILAAALYDPVWTSGVDSSIDFLIAAAGFAMLVIGRLPVWIVVIAIVTASTGFTLGPGAA